jgi:hypothetical protein
MLPTTTLPPLVKEDVAEHREYDNNQSSSWRQPVWPNKASAWGERTMSINEVHEDKTSEKMVTSGRSFVSHDYATHKLFAAWVDKSGQLLNEWEQSSSLSDVIRISERYLLAVRKSTDHRLFISSVINVLRFTEINQEKSEQLARLLTRYENKNISRQATTAFIRELRNSGFSPSSLGQVDVEQV